MIAKERVADYKKTVDESSTETKPQDIEHLEKQISKHPDIAKKANGRAKLFTEFPFLLHTNWCHDGWSHKGILQTRDVNHERIQRGGAPVWSAVQEILGISHCAKRMMNLVTYAVHNSCMNLVAVKNVGIEEEMKRKCEQLLLLHKSPLPLEMTLEQLTEVDMVAFFFAVLVDDLIHKEMPTAPYETTELQMEGDFVDLERNALEELITGAETNEKLNQDDAKGLMQYLVNHYDNCDSVDMEQKSTHVHRVEVMINRTKEKRARIKTDKFVNLQQEPVKKRKMKLQKRSSGDSMESASKKAKLWKQNDRVLYLEEPGSMNWIEGKITYVDKCGTYTVR
jgi:hypothetical protein